MYYEAKMNFQFDSRRNKGGTAQGYSRFAFDDGSMILFYWTAEITPTQDGLSSNKGQGSIIKGTGRFEGIKGTSGFSGQQLKASSEDSKPINSQKATLVYTLP